MFKFKEFTIKQDKTAMKIGTDAVLLGAWANIENYPNTILDIGSGTGILSLMLAQRCDAITIDAVEIEPNAFEQCVENFEKSDWGDRLYCYNVSFEEFAEEMSEDEETYDLIISNPPFYTDDFKSEDKNRNTARFESSLSFENLLDGVAKLLSENGVFSVIVPKKEENHFINLAKTKQLFLQRICEVQGNSNSEVKRVLMEFNKTSCEIKKEHLIIEHSRHNYTEDYIKLTKNFYLKM